MFSSGVWVLSVQKTWTKVMQTARSTEILVLQRAWLMQQKNSAWSFNVLNVHDYNTVLQNACKTQTVRKDENFENSLQETMDDLEHHMLTSFCLCETFLIYV